MMTIKYSEVLIFVRMTMTFHLINSVGGFFFVVSSEMQPTSSVEIRDALEGSGNLTTLSMSMKAEQFVLERRLADVYFSIQLLFPSSSPPQSVLFDLSNDFLIKNR